MGFKLLIAGGGVAALEGALAVRRLAPGSVETTFLAPDHEFPYRPPAGCRRLSDELDRVEPDRRVAITAGGRELAYDALLLALGARRNEALAGAITYGDPQSNSAVADLLLEIRRGEVGRVGMVVPAGTAWPLPMYELAMMTAAKARDWRVALRVDVVTPEGAPLAILGRRASMRVTDLLAAAEIRTITSAEAVDADEDGIHLASGRIVGAERVVCRPRMDVPAIPGIPQGPQGFIGTDRFMSVDGVARVWAAGDATWFPIKQDDVARQQADVAARSIAHLLDPSIALEPLRPVLNGALMSGRGTAAERRDAVELALTAADAEARWRHFPAALRWLDVAERLDLTLPPEYATRRELWSAQGDGERELARSAAG